MNKEKHSEFITEFTKSFEEFNKDTDDEKFNVMKEHHYTLCKNLLKLPEGVDELPGGSVERTNYIKNKIPEVNWNETKKVRISQGDYLAQVFDIDEDKLEDKSNRVVFDGNIKGEETV